MRRAAHITTPLFFTFCMVACSDPPEQQPCPDTGTGTGGGETGENECPEPEIPEIPEECADPQFTVFPEEDANNFTCEGIGGGALVYNSVVVGEQGGPGSLALDPPEVAFPQDQLVTACCVSPPADDETISNACETDCGRAACNLVLEQLRTAIAAEDPSNGDCGPFVGCVDRIRASITAWEASLVEQYDKCVTVAQANDDPDLAYDDLLTPFTEDRKVVLDGAECDQGNLGCLFDAELRVFCKVDEFQRASDEVCTMAGNPRDPMAPEDRFSIATGGGVVHVVLPNNQQVSHDIDSQGGLLRTDCQDGDCTYQITEFGFEIPGAFGVGMFEFHDMSAEFLGVPHGMRSLGEDEIVFLRSEVKLLISGVVEIGHGWANVQLPVQFTLNADANMGALETGSEFSIEYFYAESNGYHVELETSPAAYTPL